MAEPARIRILAVMTLPTLGAGNRLRVEQYVPALGEMAIDMELSPFFDDATFRVLYRPGRTLRKAWGVLLGVGRRLRDVARARRYDLVLVYRESAPIGPPLFERALRRLGVPYAFDFDDAVYLGPIHPANRRWAWLRHPSRVSETAKHAAAVMVQNEYLATWARQWNAAVTIIPTGIDTDRHRPRASHSNDVPIVIGWVGSSTTAPYLRILDAPLEALRRRRDFVMRVVGGEYRHPGITVEQREYRLDEEPADLESLDIGVLPEPDDPWTRGKGALKGLLYMATALPVVASRIGVNPEVILEGETGFCVDGADEWTEALDRLAGDAALRQRLGANGRERVERLYSVRVLAPRLAAVLRSATRPVSRQ